MDTTSLQAHHQTPPLIVLPFLLHACVFERTHSPMSKAHKQCVHPAVCYSLHINYYPRSKTSE
jgi:hypothetical protein